MDAYGNMAHQYHREHYWCVFGQDKYRDLPRERTHAFVVVTARFGHAHTGTHRVTGALLLWVWWSIRWELVEMGRKMLLAGALVLLRDGGVTQA